MGHLVILVPVIESEAGWGSKVDDHMVCLTVESANDFVKEFNAKNTAKTTPKWYMYAQSESDFIIRDISTDEYETVVISENSRTWLKNI